MRLYVEYFDLYPVIEDALATIKPMMDKNKNEFVCECPENIGYVRSDMTKVRQVLFNLLSNAAKFTHAGKARLTVRKFFESGREWLSVEVSDTGIGMDDRQIAGLFEAFSQADTSTTRRYGGTGLGLAISQRFCRMLGGSITVDSRIGQGSAFTVLLPAELSEDISDPNSQTMGIRGMSLPLVLEDDMESPSKGGLMLPVSPAELRLGKSAPVFKASDRRSRVSTVLIIDDDADIHDLMARILSREGFQTLSGFNGPEGLAMAKSSLPDVIVLDVMMPGMDGWRVLEELKRDARLAAVPVIMLTMFDDEHEAQQRGAYMHLGKPIRREQLLDEVIHSVRMPRRSRILLVDHNAHERAHLRQTLEQDGWVVDEADSGKAALVRIGKKKPALILLDLLMPEMDGVEVVAELRKKNEWRSIPVVLLTTQGAISATDHAVVKGVAQKDVESREELLKMIGSIVTSYATRRGAADDASVKLTPR